MVNRKFRIALCVLAIGLSCPVLSAQTPDASKAVVLEGRVIDAATGNPLSGAKVTVTGSVNAASTDRDGRFLLLANPADSLRVTVSYLGRTDQTRTMAGEPGAVVHVADITMAPPGFEETVVVEGSLISDAEARALNEQKTAPNITNVVSADQIGSLPDRNAAETTQRIAGVSITKDQGEGRYVSVRGTEARLNSMMIDGQRIPSPDPLLRQVAVDVIPSELLQAIEVSKTLTPDMDADSIGGSLNLVTKQAPDVARFLGSIGGGFNQMLSSYHQSNATLTGGRGSMRAGSASLDHSAKPRRVEATRISR